MRQVNINMYAIYCFLALGVCVIISCQQKAAEQPPLRAVDYIKEIAGPSDTVTAADAQKGKVLIAYADCYTCHAEDKRAKGPAFRDIAKRYPVKLVYIDLLAQKIISGGYGAWGNPVMSPHPNIPVEDSKLMVAYILSLKEK